LAAEADVILLEFGRELRRDARRHEALEAVLLRLLPVAFNIVAGDANLGDLAAIEIIEKLAVGNRLDALAVTPQLRDQDDPHHRGEDIPGVPLLLFVHPLSPSGWRPSHDPRGTRQSRANPLTTAADAPEPGKPSTCQPSAPSHSTQAAKPNTKLWSKSESSPRSLSSPSCECSPSWQTPSCEINEKWQPKTA
jgi:hypothetical protein